MWCSIIGLFLPRTEPFGLWLLALTVPTLILIILRSILTSSSMIPTGSKWSDLPPWAKYGATTGISVAYILRETLPESFLGFCILTTLLGWPWTSICRSTAINYNRFFKQSHAFLLALATSAIGLFIGLSIFSIRQTQVMTLFFLLLFSSVVCSIVLGFTGKGIRRNGEAT